MNTAYRCISMESAMPRASAASLPPSPTIADTMRVGASAMSDNVVATAFPTPCSSDSSPRMGALGVH